MADDPMAGGGDSGSDSVVGGLDDAGGGGLGPDGVEGSDARDGDDS